MLGSVAGLSVSKTGLFVDTSIVIIKENGEKLKWDEEERVMAAAYWGEQGNRDRMKEGFKATDADIERMIAMLTPKQVELVHAMWATNEAIFPQLAEAHHTLYHSVPPKTVALPFTVGGHSFTGGHMSLIYQNSPEKEMSDFDFLNPTFYTEGMAPSQASAMYARTAYKGRIIRLSKENIARSLKENIHFIAFAEIGREMQSLLGNPKVKAAIIRKHGEPFWKA